MISVIVERLHHLNTLDLVAPKQDQPLHEGVQPTEAALEHIAQLRRPWWRALLERLG